MGADNKEIERETRCSINGINLNSQESFFKYAWLMKTDRPHDKILLGGNWISRSESPASFSWHLFPLHSGQAAEILGYFAFKVLWSGSLAGTGPPFRRGEGKAMFSFMCLFLTIELTVPCYNNL